MFEDVTPAPDEATPQAPAEELGAVEPAVIWLGGAAPAPLEERRGCEADPEHVIAFLLKKLDEHQARLNDQDAYAELLQQELEQVRGQLQVTREELDRQLADYDVLMQNSLATERELEQHKAVAASKKTIQLPFYAEEKLAKLGYSGMQPVIAG
jgi:small-conductance mechanosensitive channel